MRRAKTQDKAFEQAMKALQAIQEAHGVDLGLDQIKPVEEPNTHEVHAQQHEVDALLLSLHKPHAVKVKKCSYCKEPFATTYCYVGYCSHHCRVRALAEFGIQLDAVRPIWGDNVEPPAMIMPLTVEKMEKWATQILSQIDQLRTQSLQNLVQLPALDFAADEAVQDSFQDQEASETPADLPEEEEHDFQSIRLELLPTLVFPDL